MAQRAELSLQDFIEKTSDGRLFTVDFVKRGDGSFRTMNCRRGVQKGVKGVGQSYDPKSHNLLTVYDMQKMDPKAPQNVGKSEDELSKGAFRNINLEALVGLRMGGKAYDYDHAGRKFIEVVPTGF